MDAALVEHQMAAPVRRLDTDRIRDILLLRLAVAGKPLARDTLLKEIGPLAAHLMPTETLKAQLDRDLAALADAGLAELKASSAEANEAGIKRSAIGLGGRGAFPKTWSEARDIRLIAKALGIENESPARLKKLARPDGLRAAVLVKAFALKLRGTPSPVKLRQVLAKIALSRAFGNNVNADGGRSGLSARAGRALAGRLSSSPQDFRTDARLIAALAADQAHAEHTDLASLQLALLRRFVTKGDAPPTQPPKKVRRTGQTRTALKVVPVNVHAAIGTNTPRILPLLQPEPNQASHRPTLQAFVADVVTLATPVAEGFVGNRKAFISRVWATIAAQRPHWGLSEVEFKCMLAEAHRLGQLVLANADLKDGRNLAEIQASALSYKNAVFHYVRVDT